MLNSICMSYLYVVFDLQVGSFFIASSPELKAPVTFSDGLAAGCLLSVPSTVRPSVCPFVRPSLCPSFRHSVRLSICKLFIISSSSPEPLGQFQPTLTQLILG